MAVCQVNFNSHQIWTYAIGYNLETDFAWPYVRELIICFVEKVFNLFNLYLPMKSRALI